MSSTAIGSASVVLSANADGLAAGLEQAERRVGNFAGEVSRKLDAGGAGGGGFLSKMLGGAAIGGAAGAVAGAVAGGVAKGFELLGELPELIRGLAEGATGPEAGPLKGLVAGIDTFIEKGKSLLGGFFASMAPGALAIGDALGHAMEVAKPIINAVGSALSRAFEFAAPFIDKAVTAVGMLADRVGTWLSPVLDKIGRGLDVVGHVFGAAFDEGLALFDGMLSGIGSVIDSISAWVGSFFSVETAIGTVESVAFGFFKMAGKGAAYVWDSLKAGVGAMSYVASFIVDGFARIVDAFQDTIKDLLTVAGTLPDALGGAGFRRMAGEVDGWAGNIERAAESMREWGASAIAGWGSTAGRVDAWLDGVEARFSRRTANMAAEAAAVIGEPLKLAGAMERGSKEAYSTVAKFNAAGAGGPTDAATRMNRNQEETNRLLRAVLRAVEDADILRTI